MIIRRYLLREVTLNFLGVALLLSVMVFSTTLIRLLNDILEGRYPTDILLMLFALKGVGNLVFILPLAFFLAVMLAFGRLYRDSEMVVLGACGVRPGQLLRMVAMLGTGIALLVGVLSLYFAPWVDRYAESLVAEASARTEIEGVIPGQFNVTGEGGPVIYAESFDGEERRLKGLFVNYSEGKLQYQLTAEQAYEQIDRKSGRRYLVLMDGYRYEGTPGMKGYRIMHFREHGLLIQDQVPADATPPRDAYSTGQLLASSSPADMAELQWRLALPVGTLLLGLLAVPLSKTSPRRGRFGGLALGFMIYLIYNNLLLVAKSSLSRGEVSAYIGMWWVQVLLLALLWLLYWRGNRMRGPARAS
ncbi:MAG: LPS export ABC transporter permease LptF [Gammaproteobacteria bacterium]|nr:LPS export ABC transporter permease LptF [Gammaproteobacteria bacterium]MCW8839667.1 LPS export ABC transporter permease LptF [Gammaproteobacteria bacterium]MCW8928202.1 LPS export ABC transporter permease LptF [Gammaproteobacteria bacterium]MCW8959455.1 LPS export ABC transporter permease LptF [Gammaproteobacteria bacterium]MCW8972829.1 LPS export ABC transporter permease LptF [Gammaproteobacteria bacterium]